MRSRLSLNVKIFQQGKWGWPHEALGGLPADRYLGKAALLYFSFCIDSLWAFSPEFGMLFPNLSQIYQSKSQEVKPSSIDSFNAGKTSLKSSLKVHWLVVTNSYLMWLPARKICPRIMPNILETERVTIYSLDCLFTCDIFLLHRPD